MEEVYRVTHQVARSNASVLLHGETGTGKELIANAIHQLSDRGGGAFVKVTPGGFGLQAPSWLPGGFGGAAGA